MRLNIKTQILSYQLQTMPPSFPAGVQYMEVLIDGRKVMMKYGGRDVRNLVGEFGEEVLRIPDYCVTLRQYQLNLLHVESSWVRVPVTPS